MRARASANTCVRRDFVIVVILSVCRVTDRLRHDFSESNASGFSAKKKMEKTGDKGVPQGNAQQQLARSTLKHREPRREKEEKLLNKQS